VFVAAVPLSACDEKVPDMAVCYTAISSTEYRQFPHAFTPALHRVHEQLGYAYNAGSEVLDIPTAQRGSLYLMTTCGFQKRMRERYGAPLVVEEISVEKYERVVRRASEPGQMFH
jgi:hypothetical protein